MLSEEEMEKIEKDVERAYDLIINSFERHKVPSRAAFKAIVDVMAMISIESKLPHEKFKYGVNQLIDSYREKWPIG